MNVCTGNGRPTYTQVLVVDTSTETPLILASKLSFDVRLNPHLLGRPAGCLLW